MRSLLPRLLRRISPKLGAAVATAEILWEKNGWLRSFSQLRPVNQAGDPLPWMTYPAQSWLDFLDLKECRIFEYGAGWGTLHWARRAREVTAVERSPAWVAELQPMLPPNAKLHGPLDGQEYINAARQSAPWDVVIVDGSHRKECAQVAAEVLKPGGLIVLDNADWFTDAADHLRSTGLTQVDFQGFGPCNTYTWTTAVFFGSAFVIPRLPSPWSGADRGAINYQP